MPVARWQFPDGRVGRFEVPEGTTPEQMPGIVAQAMQEQRLGDRRRAGEEATADTPTWQKGLVALGRGLSDIGQGAKQLVLQGGEALGVVDPGTSAAYNQRVNEELEYFKPFEEQVSGATVGRVVGSALPTLAIPGGAMAGGAGRVVSKVAPAVGARIGGSVAADAALQGMTIGGLTATGEGDSRLANVAIGGVAGPAVVGALNLAGKVATPVIRGIANRVNPQQVQAAGMTAAGDLTPATVRALERQGIDVASLTSEARAKLAQMASQAVQGNPVTPQELARAARLASLPVPIHGTKGQLTKDFSQNQLEQSLAKSTSAGGPIRQAFDEQEAGLLGNLDVFKSQTGGQGRTSADVGRSVEGAVKARIAKSNANISQLYRAAEKQGETLAPVDATPLAKWIVDNQAEAEAVGAIKAIKQKLVNIGALKVTKDGGVQLADEGMLAAIREGSKAAPEQSLLATIKKMGGISTREIRDITGEARTGRGTKGIPPALFKKDGKGLDEIATQLKERGYDIADDVDGGVQQVRDMIADEVKGRVKHVPLGAQVGRGVDDEAARELTRAHNNAVSDLAEKYDFDARSPGYLAEKAKLDAQLKANLSGKQASGTAQLKGGQVRINDLEQIRRAAVNLGDSSSAGHYMGEVKKIIDDITEGAGGTLYQKARSARIQHALQFEEPGVVQKVVGMRTRTDRAVAHEDVFQKTVVNGSINDLRTLKRTLLANDPDTRKAGVQAFKDLRAQTIQHFKDAATNNAQGVTSEAALRRAYNQIGPEKMAELFGGNVSRQFANFLEAVKDLKVPPRGSTNPSGTAGELVNWLDRILGTVGGGYAVAARKAVGKVAETAKSGAQAQAAVDPIGGINAANRAAAVAQQNERVRALLESAPARRFKRTAAVLGAAGATQE